MPLNSLPLVASLLTPVGQDVLGRDLHGQPVAVSPDSPTVLVFFSVDCLRCGAELAELEDKGLNVVGVNVDNASLRAGLRPFASLHELEAPLMADADGQLRRRYQLDGEGVVVLDPQGEVVARGPGAPSNALALLEDSYGETLAAIDQN